MSIILLFALKCKVGVSISESLTDEMALCRIFDVIKQLSTLFTSGDIIFLWETIRHITLLQC
jgi:hypothetical protein